MTALEGSNRVMHIYFGCRARQQRAWINYATARWVGARAGGVYDIRVTNTGGKDSLELEVSSEFWGIGVITTSLVGTSSKEASFRFT